MLTFDEYQRQSIKTAQYLNKVNEKFPYIDPQIKRMLAVSYVGLGLGEAGEIQNKIKKIIRDSAGNISEEVKENIAGEIGDLIWYCSNLCYELDLSFSEVAQKNIDKLQDRQKRGVITGEGDNR